MNPTERFSSRVEDYHRGRPGYPREALDFLVQETGIGAGSIVADVGSGTGKWSELLLERGCLVFGIEPNAAMRAVAEERFRDEPRYRSVAAPGEETTLPDDSVDLITVAQAFHWLNPERARKEFARILKPGGAAALIWHNRKTEASAFLRDYERFLVRWGTDYEQVRHENLGEAVMAEFYGPGGHVVREFEYSHPLDESGLRSRVLSASYMPGLDHPNHAGMLEDLKRLYQRHQENGRVVFDYATRVYFGVFPKA